MQHENMRNKMDAKQRVAVITASSIGIGFETSLIFLKTALQVYATMRVVNKTSNLMEITCRSHLRLTSKISNYLWKNGILIQMISVELYLLFCGTLLTKVLRSYENLQSRKLQEHGREGRV